MANLKTPSMGGIGYDGAVWFPRRSPVEMSTVISFLSTPEGFVIASDGRASNADLRQKTGDDHQKIFNVDNGDVRIAYGLAETIKIGDGQNVIFDFVTATATMATRVAEERPRNWWQFVVALTERLTEAVNHARVDSACTLSEEKATHIFLGGFYGKHGKSAHINFVHGVSVTEGEPYVHQSGFVAPPFGSRVVLGLLESGDSRFLQYATPPRSSAMTLPAAIQRVMNEVLAHYDPKAVEVDEKLAWTVGGRVQIATVTFSDGFRWVRGFGRLGSPEAKP
jgi:hypothetical protein